MELINSMLGICLGMQLLFESTYETAPPSAGMKLFEGVADYRRVAFILVGIAFMTIGLKVTIVIIFILTMAIGYFLSLKIALLDFPICQLWSYFRLSWRREIFLGFNSTQKRASSSVKIY